MKIIDHPNKNIWGNPTLSNRIGLDNLTYVIEYEMMCDKCKLIYTYMDCRFKPSICKCGNKSFFELPAGKAFERDNI